MKINFLPLLKPITGKSWTLISLITLGLFLLHSIFFGQSLIVYFLALFICALCILFYPEAGLYTIVVLTMWFERYFTLQSLQIGVYSYKIYPLDFVILFIILSLLFRLARGTLKWYWQKFDWPILFFLLAVALGYLVSLPKNVDPTLAFSTFKNYGLYAVVYVLAVLLLPTKRDWKEFMNWFVLGGVGLFFFLIYGIISGHGLWSEFTPLSTTGTRLIAGTHLFYLVLFGFWLLAGYLWTEGKKLSSEKYAWQVSAIILVLIGIIVGLVRHLWVALFFVFIVWLYYLARDKRQELWQFLLKIFGVAVAVIIVYVWIYSLLGGNIFESFSKPIYVLKQRAGMQGLVTMQDSSFRWRLSAWRAGVSLWSKSPVFGAGLGETIVGYDEITPFNISMRDLHNDYLGILIQMGLLGFGIVTYWFIYLLRELKKLWLKLRSQDDFKTKLMFTWGSTILLFMVVFSVSVYWDINLFIIWWWLALAGVRWIIVNQEESSNS